MCGSSLTILQQMQNRSEMGSYFVFVCLLRGEQYLLVTSELANQNEQKALFTCEVYTKNKYQHVVLRRQGGKVQLPDKMRVCNLHFDKLPISGFICTLKVL